MPELLAARFENNDSSAEMLELFDSVKIAKGGLRWQLSKYGLTRIECTVRRTDAYAAFDAYANWQGQRFALFTDWTWIPISGWITECVWLSANEIQIVAKGPFIRMAEQLIRRFYPASTTVSNVISNVLAYYVRIDDGTTDGIEANATTTGGWNPDVPEGSYPHEAIEEMLDRSNSSYQITDFWMQDNPMAAGKLTNFKPYYRARPTTVLTPDWIVYRRDLRELNLSRGINNVTTVSRIYYGLITGTFTALGTNTITDGAATFITSGVVAGDKIVNTTRGGVATVVTVNSQTQLTYDRWKPKTSGTCTGGSTTTLIDTTVDFTVLGVQVGDVVTNLLDVSTGTVTAVAATTLTIGGAMSGGKSNDAGERYQISSTPVVTNAYSIAASNQGLFSETQIPAGEDAFWQSERADFIKRSNATQAAQIANSRLSNEAEQEQSCVIGSAFVRDGSGTLWPLWEMIAQGGGTLQIVDLYPEVSASLNQETVFTLTAMDYDHVSKQMRCTLDNLDARLDSRLEQAKILSSTMVARG